MNRNGNSEPAKTGPLPSMKRVSAGILQIRHREHDADREQHDGADLEERRKIIARREQQPHRQHRRAESVRDQHPRERLAVVREQRRPVGIGGDLAAEPDREQQQHEPEHRNLEHASGPEKAQIHTHQQRDRNRHRDRERAPWTDRQRLDDDEREHAEDDEHDHQHADHRDHAGGRAELVAHHLAERTPVAAQRQEQDHEILHRAGEDHADEDPQRARQITHLRGEHRPDQRTRAGDRGEMVAEHDAAIGRHVVEAVVAQHRRRRARRVERKRVVGDEAAIEAVGDEEDRHGRGDEPERIDRFAARKRERAEAECAEHREHQPAQLCRCRVHGPVAVLDGRSVAWRQRSVKTHRAIVPRCGVRCAQRL